MSEERFLKIRLYDVTKDGFPSHSDADEGHVFFFFDGCVVSGWPLISTDIRQLQQARFLSPEYAKENPTEVMWEANDDVGHTRAFMGVRYWFVLNEDDWAKLIREEM